MLGGRHTPSFNLHIQQRGAGARYQQLSQLILSLYVIPPLPCVGLPSTCLVNRPGQKRALCRGFPVSGTCVRQPAVHPACDPEAS